MNQSADRPLLSLVIPYYNKRSGLPALLESAQRQSLRSLEVVIVDDGSEESCADIASAYHNNGLKIRLLRHKQNQGAKNARLSGIAQASGRIIAFADADDTLYGETALETHAMLMLEQEADIFQFNALFHDVVTGEAAISELDTPLAPALDGPDIFARYTELSGRGGTMWNKLYSRELCLKELEWCLASKVRWACEDFFLSAWFLFHARRYRSAESVGYNYINNFEQTRPMQAAGRMADIFQVTQEFVPYLIRHSCPPQVVERFMKMCLTMLDNNYAWQSEALYCGPGAPTLEETLGRVPMPDYARALHYAMFMMRKDYIRLYAIARRQEEQLRFTAGRPAD